MLLVRRVGGIDIFCIDICAFQKHILMTSVISQREIKLIFILLLGIEEHATRRTSVTATPYNTAMVRVCSVYACFSCTRHHIGNISAAPFAAFLKNGSLNLDVYIKQINLQVNVQR